MNTLYALWKDCDESHDNNNNNKERLAGALTLLRAHLLPLAVPEQPQDVAVFLRAVGLRQPLGMVAKDEELERLKKIEAIYLAGSAD